MVTGAEYLPEMVEAARSVLLELVRVLGAYRRHIAVIGGWVPGLVLPKEARLHGQPHSGSMDIDLAINHSTATETEYDSIRNLLEEAGGPGAMNALQQALNHPDENVRPYAKVSLENLRRHPKSGD